MQKSYFQHTVQRSYFQHTVYRSKFQPTEERSIYQKTKFKHKKGTVLIWPSGITHFHRGNPPMSDKYIATGWFQADTGQFNEHIIDWTKVKR